MTVRRRIVALLGVLSFVTACTHGRRAETHTNESGARLEQGAFVLTGAALEDGPGSLLATLTGKVPNFRLQRNSGRCPIITLRNAVSFSEIVNPHVYVDGTRATDTCVLTSLRTYDVARVEVYPQGVTRRPGYGVHTQGLILVFMKSAGG